MTSQKNAISLIAAIMSLLAHYRVHAQSSSKLRGTQNGIIDKRRSHPAGPGATSVGENILLRKLEGLDGLKPSAGPDDVMNPPHDCRCEKSSECQS
eukprot:CAMPEP_0197432162 /NCGR_PEP_ID=MMETSP1175-20131217/267_1 /TAXON_ID=1003142 /ORGANISM="Triceratium dubium, Strain CCMP147" /LENGTH=95 /DNA_ID=CAMNT_0042960167 /DNA_START=235 /DNA_END=519 /DNA_ORIENTATION=-